MRRNFHTYGMTFKERNDYRLSRKKAIANEKDAKAATISRLMDMVIAVEDAIKPEADRLFAQVVAAWKKAHAFVMANGQTWNAVQTAYTGFDCEANKLPDQPYPQYVRGTGQYTEAYKAWLTLKEPHTRSYEEFSGTLEREIVSRQCYDKAELLILAEARAARVVEDNKVKLLDGVARYMGEYQTAKVVRHIVGPGAKGFEGRFNLVTDKGPRLFTCKAITAEGPIVSFHWRYIIHVKEL